MTVMASDDLSAVQGRLLGWQGTRETRTATQGGERWEVFSIPLIGATLPGGPTPALAAVLRAEVDCAFAYAFHDEPLLKTSLSLMDAEEWGVIEDPTYMYATACVVNWRRVKEKQLIVGAKIALGVYDYPIRDTDMGMEMMVRFAFHGPAIATPLTSEAEYENSTSGPTWDMAEWLVPPV